jgi:peptidoglycan/xylan/chitin deacetylase (PgdA/CDA1 family)
MEVLDRHGVRATFFMIGDHVARRPEIARTVAAAGHAIGNHTQTHPLLILKPAASVAAEMRTCSNTLGNILGERPRLFRPPYGGRRPGVLREARAQGLLPVMWRVAGHDWTTQSSDAIEARIRRGVHGGEVILHHDASPGAAPVDRAGTIAATDRLIRRYQDDGYEFVTVPEMVDVSEQMVRIPRC